MNEIARRFIMMMGIVSIGTILIFLDSSIYLTLIAAFAFGITMAIGMGLLKKEDFIRLKNSKRDRARKKVSKEEAVKIGKTKIKESDKEKKSSRFGTFFSRFNKKEPKNASVDTSKKQEKSGFLTGLRAALGSIGSTVGKTRDKKHAEKIDNLLNSTIDEPLAPSSHPEGNQPESALSHVDGDVSDDMGFDDEDFAGLDSLEIEGEERSFTFDVATEATGDSGGLNLDDEINAILLAENAFDEDDTLSSDEGLSKSEHFSVQDIEDQLDEDSFIVLPEGLPEKQHTGTPADSLDELDTIKNFELSDNGDDAFLDFDAINLDELEMDGLSLELDEIIIEEEEDINEADIFPDDYVSTQDTGKDADISPEVSGISTPKIPDAISFSGKNEYDDILNLLQSDIKTTKKLPQKSLMRDMKDVDVNAIELEEELETVLHMMGGKSRSIGNIPERSEE